MREVVTRNTPSRSRNVIDFALNLSGLVYLLAEMRRLFNDEQLARELENKSETEIRAILKERFQHLIK